MDFSLKAILKYLLYIINIVLTSSFEIMLYMMVNIEFNLHIIFNYNSLRDNNIY